MHDMDRTTLETTEPEAEQYDNEAFEGGYAGEAELDEVEELQLAAELLEVSDEEEMEQFLGSIFKSAWKGIKKVGSTVGKLAQPLGGVLKGIAKKALPVVGGALGSFIPIPGVGTAVGTALGNAAGNLLEAELEGLNEEDREFEKARRFVRLAHGAARKVAQTPPGTDARAAIINAVKAAMKKEQARQANAGQPSDAGAAPVSEEYGNPYGYSRSSNYSEGRSRPQSSRSRNSGRWYRQSGRIVLVGI